MSEHCPCEENPLYHEPVLSEEETIKQLREDSVRQYTERIKFLEERDRQNVARLRELEADKSRLDWIQKEHFTILDDVRQAIDAAMKGNT